MFTVIPFFKPSREGQMGSRELTCLICRHCRVFITVCNCWRKYVIHEESERSNSGMEKNSCFHICTDQQKYT